MIASDTRIYTSKIFHYRNIDLKFFVDLYAYYGHVNITSSDVRNLLSTVKERCVDEMGSGEGGGWGGGGRKGKLSKATVHDRLIGTKIDTTILACAKGAPVELMLRQTRARPRHHGNNR